MPTVGWIQDSAWDRYADDFPFRHDWKVEPVLCPLCRKAFMEPEALSTHLGVDHPLSLPLLRIGKEIGFTQFAVRDQRALQDLEVYNATNCSFSNGGSVTSPLNPAGLVKALSKVGNGQYRLILTNRRDVDSRHAETSVEIRVAIPSEAALSAIDKEFLRTLAIEFPTMRHVDQFLQNATSDPVAREYAGALADYVVAVLIKEQALAAGTIAPFDTFKSRFSSARHVLSDFRTPLAQALVVAIDFNLNHFVGKAPGALPILQTAHGFFAAFSATGDFPKAARKHRSGKELAPACPIDRVTNAILSAMEDFPNVEGFEDPSPSLPGLDAIPLGEFDLAKIATLKAAAAILAGKKSVALRHLRRINHDFHFGAWAQNQLENYSDEE